MVIISIILIILIALYVWYYFLGDVGYLKRAKKEFEIFGLSKGFIPKGFFYEESLSKFFVCGTDKSEKNIQIFVIDENSKKLDKMINLKTPNQKTKIKFCDISIFKDNCFVVFNKKIHILKVSSIMQSKNEDEIKIIKIIDTNNNADFCFVYDKFFWVGEYYKLGKYKTNLTHHFCLEKNIVSHAIVLGYKLLESSDNIFEKNMPSKALAIPDMVKSMVICDGKIYVVCGGGYKDSKLIEYENVFGKKTQNNAVVHQKNIPLWLLSSKFMHKTRNLPELCNGINLVRDRVLLLFESGAKKHQIFARNRINFVFSLKK